METDKKNNSYLLPIIILVALAIIGLVFFRKSSGNAGKTEEVQFSDEPGIILYTQIGCPHCEDVEKFVEENNIKEKVPFTEKEISSNKEYEQSFFDKAQKCNLELNNIGVPLLWDGEKCLVGNVDIINFFKEKADEE